MDIGIMGQFTDLTSARREVEQAAADGFASYWVSQSLGPDTLTCIAAFAQDTGTMRIGTAVVPTYLRHPLALAQQALTVNHAIGGRLVLGVGPSHKASIEGRLGISFDKPVRHVREYLDILMPLLATQKVSVRGETLTCVADIAVPGAPPPRVMVAALGAQLLAVTGRRCDGTITWMTGPNTLKNHTVPILTAAADAAGRPAPEVVSGFPICVTGDVPTARELAAHDFAIYGELPSYRAMLDREGYKNPADIALIGREDEIADRIAALAAIGVTTFCASVFGTPNERVRTHDLLKALATR